MRTVLLMIVGMAMVGCGLEKPCDLEDVGVQFARCNDSLMIVRTGSAAGIYSYTGQIVKQGDTAAVGRCAKLTDGTYEFAIPNSSPAQTCSFTITSGNIGDQTITP